MKKLILIALLFCSPVYAIDDRQEIITGFTEKDTPVLNEELRRINSTARTDRANNAADISVIEADIVDLQNDISSLVTVPTGGIIVWTTNTEPTGFLLCYGQAVSRTTYAALFAVVSTTFGVGDGSTTFNVPDFRGRFPLGQDDMGGSSADRVVAAEADTIGSASGAETHTLTSGEMPSHTHTTPLGSGGTTGSRQTTSGNAVNAVATGSTGGGGAHDIMNPYMTLNYIIKT